MSKRTYPERRQGLVVSVYIDKSKTNYLKAFDKIAKERFKLNRSSQLMKLIVAFVNKYGLEYLEVESDG